MNNGAKGRRTVVWLAVAASLGAAVLTVAGFLTRGHVATQFAAFGVAALPACLLAALLIHLAPSSWFVWVETLRQALLQSRLASLRDDSGTAPLKSSANVREGEGVTPLDLCTQEQIHYAITGRDVDGQRLPGMDHQADNPVEVLEPYEGSGDWRDY